MINVFYALLSPVFVIRWRGAKRRGVESCSSKRFLSKPPSSQPGPSSLVEETLKNIMGRHSELRHKRRPKQASLSFPPEDSSASKQGIPDTKSIYWRICKAYNQSPSCSRSYPCVFLSFFIYAGAFIVSSTFFPFYLSWLFRCSQSSWSHTTEEFYNTMILNY